MTKTVVLIGGDGVGKTVLDRALMQLSLNHTVVTVEQDRRMEITAMSKVASFKPFYHGENSFVVLDRIKHFSMHSSNGHHGTKIHFDDGTELLVGEWPEAVRDAIEQAGKE